MSKQCVLCDGVISEKNMTAEHIIPNAIGGRKKVSGFICRDCNSRTGTEWDAELANHPIVRLFSLTVKRQKGKVKPIEVTLSNGERGYFDLKGFKPVTPVRKLEASTEAVHHYLVMGNDKDEITRKFDALVEKYRQRYGHNRVRLETDDMYEISKLGFYPDLDTLRNEPITKSIIKMMLATAFDAGINPRVCDIGLGYLRAERSLSEKELTLDTTIDADDQRSSTVMRLIQIMPNFHLVSVKGDPLHSVVEGGVVLFGCLNYSAILSRSYSGPQFHYSSCMSPETGKSLEETIYEIRRKTKDGLDN